MLPQLDRFDHIHVFVSDRVKAEGWYANVMGLVRVPELEFWASDGGPLTIANENGTVRLALFEGPAQPCRSTIAFAVDADGFIAWHRHLRSALHGPVRLEDHDVTWSLYFTDPDENPFEITSHEYDTLSPRLHGDD